MCEGLDDAPGWGDRVPAESRFSENSIHSVNIWGVLIGVRGERSSRITC